MVELKMLGGYQKLQEKHPGVKVISLITSRYLLLCITEIDFIVCRKITLICAHSSEMR